MTKAILVGVSEYPALKLKSLPLCKNDLIEMKNALIWGLGIAENNILVCGATGFVTKNHMLNSIASFLKTANKDDSLIFYFSGHGSKNSLALSDCAIDLQNLVDSIESIDIKCKIVILDSCHSGNAEISIVPQIDVNETVEFFAGYGYAVMASCAAEQTSGFDQERKISLYTRFVCDALTSQFLIQKGKKSLDDINQAILRFAEVYNKSSGKPKQTPIYRSSIGGTIFFDVEDYKPYKIKEIYQETEEYIIYSVNPIKNYQAKQLKVDVILRFQSTFNHIADYSKEICNNIIYAEVYADGVCESRYKGKSSNIITCHFGYDEMDMTSGSYICHTVWVDDTQNQNIWYHHNKNTEWINDVFIYKNSSYDALKILQKDATDINTLIKNTKEYTANIINASERVINQFHEYLNGIITEKELIDVLPSLNSEIRKWFIKQSDLPIPPGKLSKWARANENLASASVDLSLYFDKENLSKWSSDNRKQLMLTAISNYNNALEELKNIEI